MKSATRLLVPGMSRKGKAVAGEAKPGLSFSPLPGRPDRASTFRQVKFSILPFYTTRKKLR